MTPIGLSTHNEHKDKLQSMRGHSASSRRPLLKYPSGKPEPQFELIPTGGQLSKITVPVPLILGGSFTIGRGNKCDLQITRKVCTLDGLKSVSREHCKICQDERGNLTLVDNSSNGTFVNGRLCKGGSAVSNTPLVPGDCIMFGNEIGGCIYTLDLSQQRPQLTKVDIVKEEPEAKPELEIYQPSERHELPEKDPRSQIMSGSKPFAIANVARAWDLWGSSGKYLTMAAARRLVSLAVSGCPEQCLHAAVALHSLSTYHTGLNFVIAAGGVSAIASLVARGQGECRAEAAAALHSIILGSAEGRSRVRTDGGLVALTRIAIDASQPLHSQCQKAIDDMERLCAQLPPPRSRLILSRPVTAASTGSSVLYGSAVSSRPVTATSNGTSVASTQILYAGSQSTGSGGAAIDDFRPRSALVPRSRPFSAHVDARTAVKQARPISADPIQPAPSRFQPGSRVGFAAQSFDSHEGLGVGNALERLDQDARSWRTPDSDGPGESSDSTVGIGGVTDGSDAETAKGGRWWEDPSGEGYGGLEKDWDEIDDDGGLAHTMLNVSI